MNNNKEGSCGVAFFGSYRFGGTVGTVCKRCATGYYSFGHEIAHMFGCHHNRETGAKNSLFEFGYGFLMPAGDMDGYRTIMGFVN